jgi:hypothetical protein
MAPIAGTRPAAIRWIPVIFLIIRSRLHLNRNVRHDPHRLVRAAVTARRAG